MDERTTMIEAKLGRSKVKPLFAEAVVVAAATKIAKDNSKKNSHVTLVFTDTTYEPFAKIVLSTITAAELIDTLKSSLDNLEKNETIIPAEKKSVPKTSGTPATKSAGSGAYL